MRSPGRLLWTLAIVLLLTGIVGLPLARGGGGTPSTGGAPTSDFHDPSTAVAPPSNPVHPSPTFTVGFLENGLPTGTSWSVTLNGLTLTSTSQVVVFGGLPNGTYPFTVGCVAGYQSNPSSGNVIINGGNRFGQVQFTTSSTTCTSPPGNRTSSTNWGPIPGLGLVEGLTLIGLLAAVGLGSVVYVVSARRRAAGPSPPPGPGTVTPPKPGSSPSAVEGGASFEDGTSGASGTGGPAGAGGGPIPSGPGGRNEPIPVGGGGTPTTPTTPTGSATAYGIDLTLCPADWVPEGTNTVSFTATIYKCVPGQGWVTSDRPFQITFRLAKISTETGICMNKGKGNARDLWFPEKPNPGFGFFDPQGDGVCEEKILGVQNRPHRHFAKVQTLKPVMGASVVVRSEDFGAYGAIEAAAEGCVPIPPRERNAPVNCSGNVCCSGPNQVSIPRDDNTNHIANAAPQDKCGAGEEGARQDSDGTPTGDGTAGDGLTAYEEYRGFIVNEGTDAPTPGSTVPGRANYSEVHVRTDIDRKDVFVYLDDKKLDRLEYFLKTGLAVHRITDPSLINGESKREINFNRGYATGGLQHAIWLHNAPGLAEYGRANGVTLKQDAEHEKPPEYNVPGTPKTKVDVSVNVKKCTTGKDYFGLAQPPNRLEQVIAHELGHAVNIGHHGGGERHGHPRLGQSEDDYYWNQAEQTSGATGCVMRYDRHGQGWCSPGHDDPKAGARHRTYWDPEHKRWTDAPGTAYCDAGAGDGVNRDGDVANDASQGNCRGQIRVKDWADG